MCGEIGEGSDERSLCDRVVSVNDLLSDFFIQLHQQAERLADTSSSSKNSNLEVL
jgi:hypothetical protein